MTKQTTRKHCTLNVLSSWVITAKHLAVSSNKKNIIYTLVDLLLFSFRYFCVDLSVDDAPTLIVSCVDVPIRCCNIVRHIVRHATPCAGVAHRVATLNRHILYNNDKRKFSYTNDHYCEPVGS